MKSFIIAVILFALTLGCVILNAIYVNQSLDKISELSRQVSLCEESDSLSKLKEYWYESRNLLGFSIKETKLERMTELIEALWAARKANNIAETQKLCILIQELCEETREYERISIYSIF